jgi:hypothetical protein
MSVYQGGEKLSSSLYPLLRTGGILNGSFNRCQRCRTYFPNQIGGRWKKTILWWSGKKMGKNGKLFPLFQSSKNDL